jgi:uncharacterized membrane protein
MDNLYVKTTIDFIHILATITWIGGMITNIFILRPSIIKTLSPSDAGKLMGVVMKKFRILVYISIVVLGVTGIPLKIINPNYISIINFENNWEIVTFFKHICYGLLVLLAVYSFEILSPKIMKLAVQGPSAQLQQLQKRQMASGGLAFLLAIIILVLSSVMRYI